MTTKKDFIAAAKTISEISEKSEKQQVADNFVLIFKNQNQRFDSAKFYKACGLWNNWIIAKQAQICAYMWIKQTIKIYNYGNY